MLCGAQALRMSLWFNGTSTSFQPTFEGRIASDVEQCPLPEDWQAYIDR